MWFKLTMYDGKIIRINMNLVNAYHTIDENNARTQMDQGDTCYQIRESVEMIDKAVLDPKHPIRVTCGW